MSLNQPEWLPRLLDYLKRRSLVELFALSCSIMIPVGFMLYTHEVWEDFFITYRHSENLVHGHGLVFTVGERVHGFTSVLNTLLPAFFAWITQAKSFEVPLLLYQIVSLTGLCLAVFLINRETSESMENAPVPRLLNALFPLLVVLEIKITAFTMNGQEAGLMLGFLAAIFVLAYRQWPRERVVFGGICIAGLMYTRPDGFVYAGAIAMSAVAFAPGRRSGLIASLVRSIVWGILLYLPWMIFTHFYYGSFIPHTIVAKAGVTSFDAPAFGLFAPVVAGFAALPARLCGVLSGVYDFQIIVQGAWPKWSHDIAFGLECMAVTYWLIPTRDRLGRMASLCSFLILCYLTYASLIAYSCPWYYPSLSFLSLLTLLRMIVTLPRHWGLKAADFISVVMAGGVILFLAFIFSYSLRGLRLKQEVIDSGNRREIGLWLKANVADEETVYLEPLGYIGYFSQRKMRDWPGLVSPEVVAARRKIGHINYPWGNYLWAKVAEEIKPDWIVARPVEVDQIKASAQLSRDYQLVRVFNVSEQIIAGGEFYGSFITYNDAVFEIFRRKETGSH